MLIQLVSNEPACSPTGSLITHSLSQQTTPQQHQSQPPQRTPFGNASPSSSPKMTSTTTITTTNKKLILLSYRHLYQHLLRAVQYAKPARYVARDRLRVAFRNPSSSSTSDNAYHPERVARTLEFLDGAARTKGLEHKILKNLMHVWWERERLGGLSV